MSSQATQSVRTVFAPLQWLWTWNGVCFGYRRGDSLFTYDGVEIGRFVGKEIYGPDGGYLGEVMGTEGGEDRLITSHYKATRMEDPFVPAFGRPHPRGASCFGEPLYCGYDEFPSPKVLKDMVVGNKTPQ